MKWRNSRQAERVNSGEEGRYSPKKDNSYNPNNDARKADNQAVKKRNLKGMCDEPGEEQQEDKREALRQRCLRYLRSFQCPWILPAFPLSRLPHGAPRQRGRH
jgi:hypothetical protein